MTSQHRRGLNVILAASAWILAQSAASAQFPGWWTVVPPPGLGGPYPTLIGPGWFGPRPPQPLGHRITRFLAGGYAYEPVYEPPADDAELLSADDFAAEAAERFTAIEDDWLPRLQESPLPQDALRAARQELFSACTALRAGRTDEARRRAQQAALVEAARPLANLTLAQVCCEEQDWPAAARHLADGLAGLDPLTWRNVAGELARWSGPQADRARQALREAAQADPQDGDALFLLGAWHAWHGAPAEARALLTAAVAAGRDDLCVLRLLEQCRREDRPLRQP